MATTFNNAKFAVHIRATKPRLTYQVYFSGKKTDSEAILDACEEFDSDFPGFVDRLVVKVETIAEYSRRINEMAEMNEFMNS